MNVMVRLLSFHEWAKKKKFLPMGQVFPYVGGVAGLQMLAEFIMRVGEKGVATLVFPSHATESLLFTPSGMNRVGFCLDKKIMSLFQENYFVLIIQREQHLTSGNYVALKILYDGTTVSMYHIQNKFKGPVHVTDFDLTYLKDHNEIMERSFSLVMSEIDTVMGVPVENN